MLKFNKLTVTEIFKVKRKTKGYRKIAKCVCDCGNTTEVHLDNLKSGHTKSCGCHKVELATKHGFAYHPLYCVWDGIIQRCTNPKASGYGYYGGRGIKIHPDWISASNFIEWGINNGYKQGLTIDRIDVNGDYCPTNCRFIPQSEQAANTRKSIKYVVDGVTYSQRGLAKRMGVHVATLRYRLSNKTYPKI